MGSHQNGHQNGHHNQLNKITLGGLIVTLGIIYGDIGTSPLYVMSAIIGNAPIDASVILGGMSLVFWTITLQTTIKYVVFTLQADNKGEGGIFALYTLVKKARIKWLIFPAVVGGCCILGEGIITPPISVSAAVEGLRMLPAFKNIQTVPITLVILTFLFFIQQFGTKNIGRLFGPIMLVWFLMLGFFGIIGLSKDFSVLKALNPYYGIELLIKHPGGFWLMGAVFLCTTGAEALYSDMGHCGRKNVRISWMFVKLMLVINYLGQTALLMTMDGKTLATNENPFFLLMPNWFLPIGVAIATAATIVASQALISGSFTLINEAMRLNLWPKARIKYPTELKGQMYIPTINWMLFAGCVFIVLYFKESANMQAAYGLTIILGMLMSSRLLAFFMRIKHYPIWFLYLFIVTYIIIESAFLIANLEKFPKGGYITLIIAMILACLMGVWHFARKIKNRYTDTVKIDDYKQMLSDLSTDNSIQKYATHLVYMTGANKVDEIESKVIYSILQKRPKKADIYWFVHVDVMDEPYRMEYKVTHIVADDIIRVDFRLGFRVAPRINFMFRKVVEDLVEAKEVDITSRYESLNRNNISGDFKFVVIEKYLSFDNDLPIFDKLIMKIYFFIKHYGLSEAKAFGLDSSSVKVEKFPLLFKTPPLTNLKRVEA